MMSEKYLSEIRRYFVQIGPQLLRQEPEIIAAIKDIMAQTDSGNFGDEKEKNLEIL